ncbi:L-rhamnose mutarotase [Microbacterium foliorum]|uniref:L-rhamnose mutarotase n=1 Tax=Microbacterium foliorum TaxID=104336 RepID=UPI00209F778E|nr:L-rhamnose mutarotase [Microbacterium foliorum]MCP1428416.1 L-rhamnose mutarotase [Microbacterium foliorum]
MRIALHSEIRDGAIDHYRSAHVRIPDALAATFDRIGIRDWTIWRSGHRLFHLVDCEDWDAAIAALQDDPADHAWQADIGRFVEVFRDAEGAEGTAPLEEIWDLRTQVS